MITVAELKTTSPVVLVTMLLLAAAVHGVPTPTQDDSNGYTLIVAASNGTFSGYSELRFIEEQFERDPTMTFTVPACAAVQVGRVHFDNGTTSVKVVLVMAGIGPQTAGMCLMQLLIGAPFSIREMLTVGTSGVSPMFGGPNPDTGCAPGLRNRTRPLALGSACVTPMAIALMCGYCTEANSSTAPVNQCTRPRCTMDGRVNGSPGRCVYQFDSALAERVRAAALAEGLPPMPSDLRRGVTQFWAVNRATVEGMSEDETPTLATIESRCAETDTAQEIAPSGELGQRCRTYIASQLSPLTPADVACWSAMEGVGYGAALAANTAANGASIPVAFIRSGSNYDTFPLWQAAPGLWVANTTFMGTDAAYTAYTKLGYHYAVRTSNAIALAYLRTVAR